MGRGKGARKRERGRGRGDEGCGHKKKRAKTIRSTLELRRCALSQPAPSLQRRPAPAAMKSPDGQFFVEVLVAGEPQREYLHNNRTYVVRVSPGRDARRRCPPLLPAAAARAPLPASSSPLLPASCPRLPCLTGARPCCACPCSHRSRAWTRPRPRWSTWYGRAFRRTHAPWALC